MKTVGDVLNSVSINLEVEVSESEFDLATIIKTVEFAYPEFKFNRTEARYDSCVMVIFERR